MFLKQLRNTLANIEAHHITKIHQTYKHIYLFTLYAHTHCDCMYMYGIKFTTFGKPIHKLAQTNERKIPRR